MQLVNKQAALQTMRIGYGEDAHALAEGRKLYLGNVLISESSLGAVAHSDGDVLLHALTDALLSAFALNDIGHYFPPSNSDFKDINSAEILNAILDIIQEQKRHFNIHNLAAVVTLDKPKLGKHRNAIQARVAELLKLEPSQVGLSFKTSEGLAQQHIQARVTLLLSFAT